MTLNEMIKCIYQICEENKGYIRRNHVPVFLEINTAEQVYEFTVPGFTQIIRTLFRLSRLSMRKDISSIYISLYNVKELMVFQWKFTREAPPRRQHLKTTRRLIEYAENIVMQEETGFMTFNDGSKDDNYFRTFTIYFRNKNQKRSHGAR